MRVSLKNKKSVAYTAQAIMQKHETGKQVLPTLGACTAQTTLRKHETGKQALLTLGFPNHTDWYRIDEERNPNLQPKSQRIPLSWSTNQTYFLLLNAYHPPSPFPTICSNAFFSDAYFSHEYRLPFPFLSFFSLSLRLRFLSSSSSSSSCFRYVWYICSKRRSGRGRAWLSRGGR